MPCNATTRCKLHGATIRTSGRQSLTLDIVKLRLSRWGFSLGLVNSEAKSLPAIAASEKDLKSAKDLLNQVVQLFEDAERVSTKLKASDEDATAYDVTVELDQAGASLHHKLKTLSLKRFKPSTVLKRAKWALHTEKHLNRLIQDTTELVDGLIELFPTAQPPQKQLCEEEGSELASDEDVALLAPLIEELDPELSKAIQSKSLRQSQHFNITFAGSRNYGLQQGYFSGQQTNNFGGRP